MPPRIAVFACAVLILCVPADAKDGRDPSVSSLVDHVSAHRDGREPYTVDFSRFAGDRRQLPIGVFDSGIGGLTVMEAILRLDAFHNDTLQPGADGVPDFANEAFIYFGDQANMPYGNYPAQHREDLLRELILKDAVFLLGTRARREVNAAPESKKPPVKAIVIACNTATAYGLDDIRGAIRKWGLEVPVIGVIEAGARAVAESIPDDGQPHAVAVLATVGTCATGAYPKAIAQEMGRRGKSVPVVVQQGSVGLAGAIEGNPAFVQAGGDGHARPVPYQGPAVDSKQAPLDPLLTQAYQFEAAGILKDGALNSVTNYAHYDVTTVLEKHRHNAGAAIDTVVLGCTHFPLARVELAASFAAARQYRASDGSSAYRWVVTDKLQFIDPAEASARELFRELARSRLRNPEARRGGAMCSFFFSVPNPQAPGVHLAADGSLDSAYKVSRPTGSPDLEDTVAIPLTAQKLPSTSAHLVESLPEVWKAMHVQPELGL